MARTRQKQDFSYAREVDDMVEGVQTAIPILHSYDERESRLLRLPSELRDAIFDHALVEASTIKLTAKEMPPDTEDGPTNLPQILHSIAPMLHHNPVLPLTPLAPNEDVGLDVPTADDETPAEPGLRASVRFRTPLNLMLASKTVQRESSDRSEKALTLVLKDSEHYAFQHIILPKQARHVRWAELHLILFCHNCPLLPHTDDRFCQAASEIQSHRLWIDDLLTTQLLNLRSLDVCAYLCCCTSSKRAKDRVRCEKIVEKKIATLLSLPKLRKLTLSRIDKKALPDFDGPQTLLMEWPAKPKVGPVGDANISIITSEVSGKSVKQLGGQEQSSGQEPRGQEPGDQGLSGQAPSGEALNGQAPSGEAPGGQAPGGQASSGQAPSDQAPSDQERPSGQELVLSEELMESFFVDMIDEHTEIIIGETMQGVNA